MRATKSMDAGVASCISEAPRDDVTFRLVRTKSGAIMLGFIHPDDFAADGLIFSKPRACLLYCGKGTLFGSGKNDDAYHKKCGIISLPRRRL